MPRVRNVLGVFALQCRGGKWKRNKLHRKFLLHCAFSWFQRPIPVPYISSPWRLKNIFNGGSTIMGDEFHTILISFPFCLRHFMKTRSLKYRKKVLWGIKLYLFSIQCKVHENFEFMTFPMIHNWLRRKKILIKIYFEWNC